MLYKDDVLNNTKYSHGFNRAFVMSLNESQQNNKA